SSRCESRPRGCQHSARGGADFVDRDQRAEPDNAERARGKRTSRIISSRDGSPHGALDHRRQISLVAWQKEAAETHCSCRGLSKVQNGFSTILIACQQQAEGLLTFSPSREAAKKRKDLSSQSALSFEETKELTSENR